MWLGIRREKRQNNSKWNETELALMKSCIKQGMKLHDICILFDNRLEQRTYCAIETKRKELRNENTNQI